MVTSGMNVIGRPTSARPDALPRLIRLGKGLREAIVATMAYVARATGTEPGQEEIAAVLKSWFTLDEVTNQIGYLRKRPGKRDEVPVESALDRLSLRINLAAAPARNTLARAGYFIRPVAEGLVMIRRHAKSVLGAPPSDEEIARSLRSTFIQSELKNQIVHARKSVKRPA
jgi:hypothetical protein